MSLSSKEPDEEVEIYKKDFHHPYTPYPIQETFMQTVYDVLEQGKVGILESPTGTGKSLSLICGSLTWLRDFKRREFEGILNEGAENSGEPEWVIEMARERKRRDLVRKREEMEERLKRIRVRERRERDRMSGKGNLREGKRRRKVGVDGGDTVREGNGEDEFLLEDWDSDREAGGSGRGKTGDEAIFSKETLELMKSVGMTSRKLEDEEEELDDEMKIFYCSRTHSQLTQFINELRRVGFSSSMPSIDSPSKSKEEDKDDVYEQLKHLTLGSRKNLCINPKVNKLASSAAINERCAELQQSSTPKEQKCPHLPNQENRPLIATFRDHILATIRDIEDMGSLGKEISICPYYASRSVIKPAEIITLPYPLLLQKSAREALGISLKGHVVIIDEAHNLMDAIAGIYGTEMSLKELRLGREMLVNYIKRFANKLKGKNRMYLAQVVRVVNSLVGYLEKKLEGKEIDGVVDGKELLAGKTVDQINLFKLIRYLQESKLARKVESYTIHALATTTTTTSQIKPSSYNSKDPPKPSATPIIHTLASLLLALTHPTSEGQLFFNKQSIDTITLKFQLLDPASHFEPIVTEARAVILAGGTMSPFSDYTSLLFPSIPSEKITTLSCGHVIPKTSLFASTVSTGPTGLNFRWTYENRNNTHMMDELGRALVNISTVVPDGMVVFFPSYDFLSRILERFRVVAPGTQVSILSKLESKKPIFLESKTESVEDVLGKYARSIDEGRGALLFSVVGGKLSEGINFSDGLGRCVVIVGLPFPNANTAEWKRKLEFIQESTIARLSSARQSENQQEQIEKEEMTKDEMARRAKEEAMDFYQNVCMRAVNQSVGRAIRHRGDWAGILMLDERYARENVKGKLAGWIRGEVKAETGFGRLIGGLGAFCKGKRG